MDVGQRIDDIYIYIFKLIRSQLDRRWPRSYPLLLGDPAGVQMLGEPSMSAVGSLGQRPRPGDSMQGATRSIAVWENGNGEKPLTICHYPKEASLSQTLLFYPGIVSYHRKKRSNVNGPFYFPILLRVRT